MKNLSFEKGSPSWNNNDILKDQLVKKSYRFIDSQNLKKLAIPSLIKKIIKYLEDENLF